MEFTKEKIWRIAQTTAEAHQCDLVELSELQLVNIGGGIGEVTFG